MAGAKTTPLCRLYAFVVGGLLLIGLNIVTAQNNSTTAAPIANGSVSTTGSASTVLPSTVNPAIGYGHFNLSGCILLDISCSVSVDLHVDNNVKTVVYNLPLNAVSSGSCSEKVSSITLAWKKGPAHLALSMKLENEEDNWKTSSLAFTAKADNQSLVTNGTEKEVNASQSDTSKLKITAGHDKSFKCDQDLDITLQGNVKVTVTIKKIQLQPFGGNDGADFGEADVCFAKASGNPAEPVDTVVPIAVGCVLAGLIVILIITYFVGRCKRPGYEKM